jgi:rhodanese-related sulfurtransferase
MTRRGLTLALLGNTFAFAAGKELSPEELGKLLERSENLFFLDVREPEEIRQSGSVKGYHNIPLGQLDRRISEVPRDKLIVTL